MKRIAAVVIVACLVASCGDDDDGGSSTDTATAATPGTSSGSSDTTAPAASSAEVSSPASVAGSAVAATGEPIKVGWANDDEGVFSFPGMTVGADVAVEYINAELGGVDGRPIELVKCSMTPDEASSAQCGQELANDSSLTTIVGGINLVSGPFFQATSGQDWTVLGALPLTAADYAAPGVVYYGSGVVGQIGAAAYFLANGLDDVSTLALVYEDNPAAAQAADQVKAVVEPAGITVTAVPVATGAADFTVPITAAGADDADAFMVLTDQRGCIAAATAIDQLGIDTQVIGVSACSDDAVFEAVGDKIDGWYYADAGSTPRLGRGVDPEVDTYLDAWDTYGEGAPTQSFSYYGWGTLLALQDVLAGLGADGLDKDAVAAAIQSFTGPVPLGSRTIACPGPVIPTVCTNEGRIFQIQGDTVVEANGGAVIDPTAEG